MRTILMALAVLALTACGSTDNQYQSPFAGSQTVGTQGRGSGGAAIMKARYTTDDLQDSVDRLNRRR